MLNRGHYTMGEPDSRGRRSPEPVPGSEEVLLPMQCCLLSVSVQVQRTGLVQPMLSLDGSGRVVAAAEQQI